LGESLGDAEGVPAQGQMVHPKLDPSPKGMWYLPRGHAVTNTEWLWSQRNQT